MRKGQVEIVGLLVIVIIVSLILLLVLKYYIDSEPETPMTDYVYRDLASSWVGAILETHSQCTDDTKMSRIIIDCVKHPPSGSADLICQGNTRSCEFAKNLLAQLLHDTMDEWKIQYELQIISPSNQLLIDINSSNLKDTGSTTTFVQPLPVDTSGYQTMNIKMCIGGKCEN